MGSELKLVVKLTFLSFSFTFALFLSSSTTAGISPLIDAKCRSGVPSYNNSKNMIASLIDKWFFNIKYYAIFTPQMSVLCY